MQCMFLSEINAPLVTDKTIVGLIMALSQWCFVDNGGKSDVNG